MSIISKDALKSLILKSVSIYYTIYILYYIFYTILFLKEGIIIILS